MLDALGTKGVWKGSNFASFMEEWSLLTNLIRDRLEKFDKKEGIETSFFAFSDTIIIAFKGSNTEKILSEAAVFSSAMVSYGIIVGIYLRGCISIGKIYEYENMIIGPAIDEAAENYQKSNWIGVHVTSSAYSALLRILNKNNQVIPGLFFKYNVPTKTGTTNTWAITLIDELEESEKKQSGVDTLINFIHNKMEKSDDVEGLEKWKNTLEFMLHVESLRKTKS